MGRPTRHEYFMDIATAISRRATCDRAHVGAVFVLGDRIIATGYNGSPPGFPHCDDVGHDMESGHCIRTVHAEMNAVFQCASYYTSPRGAICYSTTHPCIDCVAGMYSVGVRYVIYKDVYRSMSKVDAVRLTGYTKRGFTVVRLSDIGKDDAGTKSTAECSS